MQIRNRHVLTTSELNSFNDLYVVELLDDSLLSIYCKTRRINTVHTIADSFNVFNNAIKKKIKIDSEVSKLWSKYYKDKYTLFDVQTAANMCILMYLDVTKQNVDSKLKLLH